MRWRTDRNGEPAITCGMDFHNEQHASSSFLDDGRASAVDPVRPSADAEIDAHTQRQAVAAERRDARPGLPVSVGKRLASLASCMLAGAALWGCGETAHLSVAQGTGPRPELPAPTKTLLPTVNIAPATGWPQGTAPQAAAGLQVVAFASGLDHPRWLLVLPNGDVLVAESNAPPKPEGSKGIRDYVMALVMKRAGAGTPSANRITLLRDADGDGIAETRSVLLSELVFTLRHGLDRRTPVRGQCRRGAELSLPQRRHHHHRHPAPSWSICRAARSTTTGRRTCSPAPTAASCMSAWAPTAMSASAA